jgi:anaerobic selenocysteine-containing dehydrogenase
LNRCGLLAEVFEEGQVTAVRGDRRNPLYGGYSCVKGRAQHTFLRHPQRLLHSLKRQPDGRHVPLASAAAMDGIATRLSEILARHGPRSIASYAGTMAMATASTARPVHDALFDAIGTSMRFDPNTLDKGGRQVAESLLGHWRAPAQGFDRPDAILLIGTNPLLTYTGLPAGSPGRWLADTLARGCRLIVIDPRRTETAARATRFIQPRPGRDVPILAAMIAVIIAEGLVDASFVEDHVTGLDRLARAVAGFTPEVVARSAGITAEELVCAAREYATAARGYAMAGTGPNMSGHGSAVEYLVLVLETLGGHWLRAGEAVPAPPTLLPAYTPRAAAKSPPEQWASGERMRVRELSRTRAGLPTAALAEEIMLERPGRIRALVSWGGNPAVAFPDQERVVTALRGLELFVQIDPWYSESARLADYVIAPTMPLEVPATTMLLDVLAARGTGYGIGKPYAQYAPAIAAVPPGSDLIEEWRFFAGVMSRMGYGLTVRRPAAGRPGPARTPLELGMTTDELIERLAAGSRVTLAEVKAAPHGAIFADDPIVVQPPDAQAPGRLDVGRAEALSALPELWSAMQEEELSSSQYPLRLLCRRTNHTYNTSANTAATNLGKTHNPVFAHPADLADLGIPAGAVVELRSGHGMIHGIAGEDAALRRGTISMAFY